MPKRRKRLPFPVDAYPQWLEWIEQHSSSASDDGRWVREPHASVLVAAALHVERASPNAAKKRSGATHHQQSAAAKTTASAKRKAAPAQRATQKRGSTGKTPHSKPTPGDESDLTRAPHRTAANDAASSGARFWALLRGTAEKNHWAGTALIVPYEALTELQLAAGRTLPTEADALAAARCLLADCEKLLSWLDVAVHEPTGRVSRIHEGRRRLARLTEAITNSFQHVPPRTTDDAALSMIASATLNLRAPHPFPGRNDVAIDPAAWDKLRRGSDLVRIDLQEREAKAAEDGGTSSPRRRPKRGGRPAVTKAEARKREALVDKWQRAKTARTGQKEFCEDAGISLRELIRAINWLTQRRRRNGA